MVAVVVRVRAWRKCHKRATRTMQQQVHHHVHRYRMHPPRAVIKDSSFAGGLFLSLLGASGFDADFFLSVCTLSILLHDAYTPLPISIY